MKYKSYMLFLITIFVSILSSCLNEELLEPSSSSMESSMKITTRSALNPDSPDDKISSLRIMAFDHSNGKIALNQFYAASDLSDEIVQEIRVGYYDMMMIANEPQDGEIKVQLSGVKNKSELNNISLPAAAFDLAKDIPMACFTDNVEVLLGNAGVKIDGTTYSTWNLALNRLAVRVDLNIQSPTGSFSDLKGITFSNIPENVPLMGGDYTGAQDISRTYTTSDQPDLFQQQSPAPGAAWAVNVNRIILPSCVFTPANQKEKRLTVSLDLGNAAQPNFALSVNEAGSDYTLPANTHFTVNGIISSPIQVNIAASEWERIDIDGDISYPRILTVSASSVFLSYRNIVRVYFYSNQSDIYVEPIGLVGATGTDSFVVNDLCPGITGPSASNFHYIGMSSSSGYLELYTNLTSANTTHRIYLNAGGLRREITIHTPINEPVPIKYVGTFHRWNQTGERLIGYKNTGTWTAEVVYPLLGETPFVVLTTSRILNPTMDTALPDDAENYQITDGSNTVSGNGNIFFRVGMTGKLASASTPPRYARIRVTTESGTDFIFVRQGEASDYVMRRNDLFANNIAQRTVAVKFVPFNLTDPNKETGKRVDRGPKNYTFTDYPSQSGYLFHWSGTQAWAPGANAVDWSPETIASYWNTSWETCPPGYRRYKEGATDRAVDITDVNILQSSEIRQSLWLEPTANHSNDSPTNIVGGYYADGFFDRRQPYRAPGTNAVNYCVDSGPNIAFAGVVCYNPKTFASLFLPASTRIDASSGVLLNSEEGGYFSSSLTAGFKTLPLTIQPIILSMSIQEVASSHGCNIRCVAE